MITARCVLRPGEEPFKRPLPMLARTALNNAVVLGGGKSADKAVCAAESLALSGRQRGRSSRRVSLAGMRGGPQAAAGAAGGGQASAHAPLSRVRPRLMRLRRLRAAVRCLSQALFLTVPR